MSPSTDTSSNSRTSSPALAPQHSNGVNHSNLSSPSTSNRTGGPQLHTLTSVEMGHSDIGQNEELTQLLKLLNMEKYQDNLHNFSVKQVGLLDGFNL